jgi:inosose dehydratase
MADVPEDLEAVAYHAILAEVGLQPAPGYVAAPFERTSAVPEILDRARRCAREHAALGLTEVFVAGDMVPHRKARPAVGAGSDRGTLAAFTQNLGRAADVMAAEGVLACLHPHVGTLVETEDETRFVLDNTDPDTVRFGPDTGHLYWAGVDPAAIIADYAARVGAVHLKDVHRSVAVRSVAGGASYDAATRVRNLWTEPGHGDVDLPGVITALPEFTGWWVVEVDVPDRKTPEQSAASSAAWVADHIADRGVPR